MKSWKLQQLEKDLVKIVNNTLRGEIQEIVNLGGETLYLIPGNRYPKLLHKISSMQAKLVKELVILLAIVMSITANNCHAAAWYVGRFVNPITDVCWKCLFPITIAGFKVVSSSMPDTNASGRLICFCPKPGTPVPVYGIPVGFWKSVRLVDVSLG